MSANVRKIFRIISEFWNQRASRFSTRLLFSGITHQQTTECKRIPERHFKHQKYWCQQRNWFSIREKVYDAILRSMTVAENVFMQRLRTSQNGTSRLIDQQTAEFRKMLHIAGKALTHIISKTTFGSEMGSFAMVLCLKLATQLTAVQVNTQQCQMVALNCLTFWTYSWI